MSNLQRDLSLTEIGTEQGKADSSPMGASKWWIFNKVGRLAIHEHDKKGWANEN